MPLSNPMIRTILVLASAFKTGAAPKQSKKRKGFFLFLDLNAN
jgi:hypothetical protein